MKRLLLLGGEPLLHPDVIEIMKMSRSEFPHGKIQILTNGVLLASRSKKFWEACKESGVEILYTPYPVNVQYEKVKAVAEKEGVSFHSCYPVNRKKTMKRFVMDLSGEQDPYCSFMFCQAANDCIFLKDGKLYTCALAPNIEHFNKKFDQDLLVTENDRVDIYGSDNLEEIMKFLSHPIPFCRYCKPFGDMRSYPWSVTEGKIEEWT